MRGRKPLLIFLIVPLLFSLFSCGGGGSGSSYSPPADTPGLPYSLSLLPSQSIAQTNSSIILNAKVLDGNGAPVPNVAVTFTNLSEPFGVIKKVLAKLRLIKSIGILSATVANTNSIGIASVTISSTTEGFATVQAEVSNSVGISRVKKTFFFAINLEPQATPAPTIGLFIEGGDNVLFKSPNDNQRTIRAEVFQGSSPAPLGTDVTFGADFPFKTSIDGTCSDGSTSCSVVFPNGNVAKTDSSGVAKTVVQVNPSSLTSLESVLNITASATINSQSAFNLISLFLLPVTISNTESSLSATPTVLAANQTEKTSTITAAVMLSSGGPVFDGTSVNFSTTCGSVDPFAQTTDGIATAKFTAPANPGKCTVSASAAGVPIGNVDITITAPLAVQPGKQSVSGVTGGTATFTIFDGVPGYTVISNNSTIAFNGTAGNGTWNVASSGSSFTVTVPAGAVTALTDVALTVRDQAGTTVAATLTITGPNPLLITPPTATVASSASPQTVTFNISGGTGGYVTTSNEPSKAFNTTAGNGVWNGDSVVVTFPANVTAGTVTLTVFDSSGATTTATITIQGPSETLRISPQIATVASSASSQTVTFNISGGSAPYVTTSNEPSKAFNTTAGNGVWNTSSVVVTFPANVTAGTVTLTVLDSAGTNATATITIQGPSSGLRISPQTVTVVSSTSVAPITFTISGGTGPYVTTSTDPSKAYDTAVGDGIWNGSSVTVNFAANMTAGTVTLNVLDSVGGTTTATITILAPGSTGAMTVTPSTVSVTGVSTTADNVTFTISGGVTPYQGTVLSNNTAVVPNATVSGSTFTVTPNPVFASTAVTMTVLDNVGNPATATVTVTPAASSLGINPSTIAVTSGTNIAFTIIGGVSPFDVYSSDTGLLTINGSTSALINTGSTTFTGNALAGGNVTVTVVDNDSKTVTSTVTITGGGGGGGGGGLFVVPSTPQNVTGILNTSAGLCSDANTLDDLSYTISGGVAPYSAVSSNTVAIPNCSISIAGTSMSIDPMNVGAPTTVSVVIFDSSVPALSTSIQITVNP